MIAIILLHPNDLLTKPGANHDDVVIKVPDIRRFLRVPFTQKSCKDTMPGRGSFGYLPPASSSHPSCMNRAPGGPPGLPPSPRAPPPPPSPGAPGAGGKGGDMEGVVA